MPTAKPPKPPQHNWYPPWAPRFWNGMRISDYWRLLRENHFQIDVQRYPMSVLVGGCTVMNSCLAAVQNFAYGQRVETTELIAPPIFVVGHWRSGTTLLHELLALDERHAFPSNFDAFLPHHFLISQSLLYPLISLLMPPRRPMDEMSMSVASPQEDDFALCASGAPTPYRRIAFPNRELDDYRSLNLDLVDEQHLQQLRAAMENFCRLLTLKYGKRLALKSPPHTGRIEKLSQWFPEARFIHISRHPYKLVPSTLRLWRMIDQLQGFQLPRYSDADLQRYVFECQRVMYEGYFRQRSLLPKNRLAEIRFEDLVAAPVEQMQSVYQQLELDDFELARPRIESYFQQKKDHQVNRLEIDQDLKQAIDDHWQNYRQQFHYD